MSHQTKVFNMSQKTWKYFSRANSLIYVQNRNIPHPWPAVYFRQKSEDILGNIYILLPQGSFWWQYGLVIYQIMNNTVNTETHAMRSEYATNAFASTEDRRKVISFDVIQPQSHWYVQVFGFQRKNKRIMHVCFSAYSIIFVCFQLCIHIMVYQ